MMLLIYNSWSKNKSSILLIVRLIKLNSFGTSECPNVYEFKQKFNYLKLNIQEQGEIISNQVLQWFQHNIEGNVLIHSQFGINRAPALIASIVQQITQFNLNEILQTISFKKPDIKVSSKIQEQKELIQLDQYFQQISAQLKPQIKSQKNCAFKCVKCRTDVFVSTVLVHGIKPECNHYFVERPLFIEEYEQDGKISCQKCNQRVGDFKYIGSKCNCGEYICPAYMYNKSKVDKKII
ncbi:unnamed protein product [Paramecium sonneborni]|uniref:protein-tyrosine-phosphatase n=1 Tax=Paramecium sonneborni TaxID=65129 RepID=A0A8S1QN84_9CILI|nr:unnamed protein product [Paramecium sonneborni]